MFNNQTLILTERVLLYIGEICLCAAPQLVFVALMHFCLSSPLSSVGFVFHQPDPVIGLMSNAILVCFSQHILTVLLCSQDLMIALTLLSKAIYKTQCDKTFKIPFISPVNPLFSQFQPGSFGLFLKGMLAVQFFSENNSEITLPLSQQQN